jgi:predicted nucleic acid-binding protein
VNYLLDTNIISEVRKGSDCSPSVATWYDSVDEDSIYLSVLVLGEIRQRY